MGPIAFVIGVGHVGSYRGTWPGRLCAERASTPMTWPPSMSPGTTAGCTRKVQYRVATLDAVRSTSEIPQPRRSDLCNREHG